MIRVSEIFGPTIQGEGAQIGKTTVFVRTGGCDYRCTWCDTPYAVDSQYRGDWKMMDEHEIFAKIQELSGGKPLTITLTGGNPAIQPLDALIKLGKSHGYDFAMETQGSIAQDWFAGLNSLVLSPKPPSSGMETDWTKFDDCLRAAGDHPHTIMKIIVFDEKDYAYAKMAAEKYPHLKTYLQPGNASLSPAPADNNALMDRMRWLVEKVTADGWFDATILPQLHVMVWGNMRGV